MEVKKALFRYFDRQKDADDDSLKTRTLILALGFLAAVIELVLAIIYLELQCLPMVACALLGTVATVLCIILANRWHTDLAGLLFTGGIVLLIVADDYFVGYSNNSVLYLFTILVFTMLVPYKRRGITVALGVSLPLLAVGLYIFAGFHTPPFAIGDIMYLFAMINILVTAVGVILLIVLSRLVSRYVVEYHQKKIKELETQSYRDTLTRMYNRRYAEIHFRRLADKNTRGLACIAMVDIDDFKKINDTYGHEAGDTALREMSQLLRDNLRNTDLVIRWGGEEFVLVLHDATLESAYIVLDKLRKMIAEHIVIHNELRFQMTVTIGVAPLNPDQVNVSLEECDQKLYEGKRSTKNVVVI